MKKLIDLFTEEKSYIIELKINDNYYLFIEALTENNEAIQKENFDVKEIKNIGIELCSNGEYIETIESYYITPEEKIEDLKEKTFNLIESYE